ncbi:TonB-dependent receptor [Magnetovibrio blakemorei]|uniref:TonB-dependent receptor n=2 Tax=Magnetovibrio blakemorei TaxID=28181 RepID=A0A1E5Q5F8_9PROT|nr:TonB-dependent receptor [Magnetovibrio blakemorei]
MPGKTAIVLNSLLLTTTAAFPLLAQDALPELTVTGTREAQLKSETPASVGTISGADIQNVKPTHPTEVFNRIAGAHVAVTNGEGHTMALRQPMTTSPVYLYLEDGIPTRSTGFFNHNALYEINVPQAGGIEVLKGPGSALQGSDAIGGVINVLTREPSATPETEASLEVGSFGYMRALGSYSTGWEDDAVRASVNLNRTDGWRDSTAYDRQATTARWDHFMNNGGMVKTTISASNINQQTAGSSRLYRADYETSPKTNYTPISFRKVKAVRLSSNYELEDGNSLLSVTPYLRWNSMNMLPNWSLGYDKTVYTTGHSSLGMTGKYRLDFKPYRSRLVFGADADYSPGSRDEKSITTTKVGNVYTDYAEADQTYKYDVTFMSVSPYVHGEISPTDKLRLTGGLRADGMRYVYDNDLSVSTTGNYRRAPDNTVNFLHFSPKLGATYAFTPNFNGFASYRHAFRAPSEGTLFRSGKTADTMHLDAVKIDSYEIGVRGSALAGLNYEFTAYTMTKRDDIVTYTDGTGYRSNTNAGKTLHQGGEATLDYRFDKELKLNLASSYSKHTYEEWSATAGVIYDGKEMPSAPRWLNSAVLSYSPVALPGASAELEWVHMGTYFMDNENTTKYDGHHLFNLRGTYQLNDTVKLFGRAMNLADKRHATATSYTATKGEEFAPGMPRTFFVGVEATF